MKVACDNSMCFNTLNFGGTPLEARGKSEMLSGRSGVPVNLTAVNADWYSCVILEAHEPQVALPSGI